MGSACCRGRKIDPIPSPSPPVSPPVVRRKTSIAPIPIEYVVPKAKSPPLRREYSAKQSFTNIGVSTSNPLKLIEGYEIEPLVSLEEALKPFYDKIDQLSDYIKEAKTNCHYPSEHNMTRDESAAIYIYTMRWGEGCLYDQLQAAWDSEDRAKLKPWLKYLKLFRTALDKLPNAKLEVWQGKAFDETLKETLSSTSLSFYSSMGSCLQSQAEVKEYLEKHGAERIMIVGYTSADGKVVAGYTANNFNEVMLWAGTKLGVSHYDVFDANGSVVFHLTGPTQPKPKKTRMAKRCLIGTCKREAETYCYHCSRDVCTKHYLEHKKSIQEQLHPLVDEINLIYDRLHHDDKNQTTSLPPCLINVCSELDKWREDCHHRIDIAYSRVRNQIEDIIERHKHDETQKAVKNLESLEKMRQQLTELLREGDVTYRQLETMKQQVEEIKTKDQEPIRYPDIHVTTQKIDVDKYVGVTTDIKHLNEKQDQQPKSTQKIAPKKSVVVHHRFAGWSSSGKTTEKCPMCSEIFPLSMSMTDRTVHINDHLPD